jgi:hypothetical protein
LHGKTDLHLNDVLGGASPDYAVIARKSSHPEIQTMMASAWHRQYGLSTEALAELYRLQSVMQQDKTADQMRQMNMQISTLRSLFLHLHKNMQEQQTGLQKSHTPLDGPPDVDLIESIYTRELEKVYASRSWRLTAPVRWVGLQAERLREDGFLRRLKALVKAVAKQLWRTSQMVLDAHPRWRVKLRKFGKKIGAHEILTRWIKRWTNTGEINLMAVSHKHPAHENLTPEASAIASKLKKALNKRVEN